MMRYIFLSLLALILLTACGGNKDLELLIETRHCEDCNLKGVDLSGHDLIDADITFTNLSKANLRHANLTDAHLHHTANKNGPPMTGQFNPKSPSGGRSINC
jgi:uncharacterized protein YjbI with pentapeptide repeats